MDALVLGACESRVSIGQWLVTQQIAVILGHFQLMSEFLHIQVISVYSRLVFSDASTKDRGLEVCTQGVVEQVRWVGQWFRC